MARSQVAGSTRERLGRVGVWLGVLAAAVLEDCELDDAVFSGARLRGARLIGSKLNGMKGIADLWGQQ
jgi:uncharacterized protein YjbI with pentapeptide repeats